MSAHIQYELDALNAATAIANVARLGRQWVVAGLADMWAHCFRSHTDEVSDIQLAGFFSEPIGPVLEGFGFLERIADGRWRVKGTGRYVSLSEKRKAAGSKGGKATQASSKTPPKPASGAGGTEAKSSKGAFAQASDKQTTPDVAFASASKQATTQANGENTGANQALKPRSNISSPTGKRDNARETLREGGEGQAGPGGAGSLTQAAPVEVQRAPRVPDPYRPPEEGESLESFFARYPWPVSSADVVHQHAMLALTRHCARTKQRVRDVREALTRERHGDLAEIDVGDERQAVAV